MSRRIIKKLAWLLITSAAFAQNVKVEPAKSLLPYDADDAYEVFAAILAFDPPEGDLLIADSTVAFSGCQDPQSGKAVASAIIDYRKTNQTRWRLQKKFNIKQQYKLVSDEEISSLKHTDPKGGFSWYFPDRTSITHLSAVGFSKDKTIAFVAMDVQCGGLCGHGTTYVLQRVAGKWKRYEPPATMKLVKKKGEKGGTQTYDIIGGESFSSCYWNY